jgi:methylated-DNA-[protein]-cysteine S-methyltransferase
MAMDELQEREPTTLTGRALKRRVRECVSDGSLDEVAEMAERDHRVMASLIALTYDADPTVAWRSVEALGDCADRIADREPDTVRNYLRRLFWLITEESGGICWFAPQGMAEIARVRPDRFGDFVPITINLLREMADEDLEHFRPGILWAIGRMGPLATEHLDDVADRLESALDHPDPQVRGVAAWALGEARYIEPLASRPSLLEDDAILRLYGDREIATTTVAALARRALGSD